MTNRIARAATRHKGVSRGTKAKCASGPDKFSYPFTSLRRSKDPSSMHRVSFT